MNASEVLFVVLLGILVNSIIALTDEQNTEVSKFMEVSKICLIDHPLTADDIIAFKDKKFPDEGNAGCFVTCVFRNLGIINEQGQLSDPGVFSNEDELKIIEDFLSTYAKARVPP